jgi:hypothetical protein
MYVSVTAALPGGCCGILRGGLDPLPADTPGDDNRQVFVSASCLPSREDGSKGRSLQFGGAILSTALVPIQDKVNYVAMASDLGKACVTV